MLLAAPAVMMLGAVLGLQGTESWLAAFGTSPESYLTLGRIGLAVPYAAAAMIGVIFVFAAKGSLAIQSAGLGVLIGGIGAVGLAGILEAQRLSTFAGQVPPGTLISYFDFYTLSGAAMAFVAGMFGLRVALRGNSAFGATGPRRLSGRRAIHGDSHWMDSATMARLLSGSGGIVLGERYRVDEDSVADINFDPRREETWGKGGKSPLVCFDCGFGSTHGIVFAGSGGYKTTSVVVPTALKFKGSMIVLDPSTEIAPMVAAHREAHGQDVLILDPKRPNIGFNVLDWIGRFGNAPEEDIASVAAWLMSEKPRVASGSDDFFRVSAEQLITGVIADVMLSDPDDTKCERSLRIVRARLAEPEETLKEKLADLYQSSTSRFVKEVIAPFINMTPQTFSGVYATAAKETHWLSYDNYAAIVSGNTFRTDDISNGRTTVFINVDLSTLENHPGMARVVIGAFLKAIYNRNGALEERRHLLPPSGDGGARRQEHFPTEVGRGWILKRQPSRPRLPQARGLLFGAIWEARSAPSPAPLRSAPLCAGWKTGTARDSAPWPPDVGYSHDGNASQTTAVRPREDVYRSVRNNVSNGLQTTCSA